MTAAEAGDAATELLATKLHAPRQRRALVRRSRLTDRMTGAHLHALTLVSAPAGFGKTTLLSEWLDAARSSGSRAVAWLALDERDNDPAVFGAYLLAALRSASPESVSTADRALQSAQPLQSVVAALVDDLETLDTDVCLVLDDYHTIDAADVHDAVAFLVEHAPPRFHLAVATRSDPPLPLARWRARGDLAEVRARDLRFTTAEAAAYFHDVMAVPLSATDVDALEARTEGWIVALQLAALSLQGRDDVGEFIDSFAGDDRFVLDYLAEEVLERLPDDVRRFLLETSVLERLSGPLCDAVTCRTGGRATLEMLERANLFLVALDDRRQWYRYHHLFADVLRARLLDEQPELVNELHLRACDWFDRHGEPAEAIRHAMLGQHLERAAQLVELAVPMLSRTRQEATLRRWLEALPAGLFDARPVLTIALVGARMAIGDPSGVEQLLDTAERWVSPTLDAGERPIVFDHDEFRGLPAQIAVYRAGLALLAGDTAATIAHASRVPSLAEPTDHFRLGAAAALTGLAHWSVGDLDQARRQYRDAIDHLASSGRIADVLGCSLGLADILVAQGRLREAKHTYESALELARSHGVVRGTADMHVALSELSLEWNELDDAAHHLRIASELGEAAGLPQHPYRWRAATARWRQRCGDGAEAMRLLDEAERLYNTDFSPAVRPIPAVKARLQLALGDVASAARWAADRGLTAHDDIAYVREYEQVTLARVLLAESTERRSSPDAAIQLLERLLAAAEEGHREATVIELLVLLAIGLEARGDHAAATAAVEQALVRAEPEGQIGVFLEAGEALTALLRGARLTPAAARHAGRVLAAAGPSPTTTPSRRRLVDELSGRELDVLRLLRSELSGPDIARELHVSLNTLRTHTKNIYTKLGATNRREALRLATEFGL